MNLSSCL